MAHPRLLGPVLALTVLVACAQTRPPEPEAPPDYARPLPPGAPALVKITDPAEISDCRPAFTRGADLLDAIDRSTEYLGKPSSLRHYPMAGITHDRCGRSLRAFHELLATSPDAEAFQAALRRDFDFYRAYGFDGRGSVYVTAYCTPIYPASLERTDRFRYPLYRLPPEVAKDRDGKPLGWRTGEGVVGASPPR